MLCHRSHHYKYKKDDYMNRFATLIIGSALSSLVAAYGFAAESAPETTKPTAAPAAASTPAAPAASADATLASIKIGFIDMSKVAEESAEGKAATDALKAKSEKLRKKIEAQQKQLEKQKEAIQAKLPSMTPKERAAKGKEFEKKVDEYQKMVRASELEVTKLQDRLTKEVGGVIKKAASDFAKANGYLLIAEEKAVLFLDDKVKPKDLTEELIAFMAKSK